MNKELWEKCVKFPGHECPGLAIGYKASEAAKEKMGLSFSKDEEIICVTENDACGESTAECKIRIMDGKKVCGDCFKEYSRGF